MNHISIRLTQTVARLDRCQQRIKVLRDDNQRLWTSRLQWKNKHAEKARENTALRRRVRRLEDRLATSRLAKPEPPKMAAPRSLILSDHDVKRILAMPVRRD